MAQENVRQDVNGSSAKPFPTERNFTMGDTSLGEGRTVSPSIEQNTQLGLEKYARREGAPSIYKDTTRQTQNDRDTSAKAEGSCVGEEYEESEESQGI